MDLSGTVSLRGLQLVADLFYTYKILVQPVVSVRHFQGLWSSEFSTPYAPFAPVEAIQAFERFYRMLSIESDGRFDPSITGVVSLK